MKLWYEVEFFVINKQRQTSFRHCMCIAPFWLIILSWNLPALNWIL